MLNNATQLLGLAARARCISTGEQVLTSVRSQKAKLVIIALNASDNTKKKLTDKCTFYKVPYVWCESSEVLSQAIGQNNRMAVAINDPGFADKLYNYLKG